MSGNWISLFPLRSVSPVKLRHRHSNIFALSLINYHWMFDYCWMQIALILLFVLLENFYRHLIHCSVMLWFPLLLVEKCLPSLRWLEPMHWCGYVCVISQMTFTVPLSHSASINYHHYFLLGCVHMMLLENTYSSLMELVGMKQNSVIESVIIYRCFYG